VQNAVAHIQDRGYLRGGGGITALEAYHAGAVRTILAQNANMIVQPFGVSVASICQVRSERRQGFGHRVQQCQGLCRDVLASASPVSAGRTTEPSAITG